ncbi:MAG: hypothetical protein HOH13_09310 [Crocinitomicaceae bacterium]|nr:hypothetical protein [Crocinitomicaceae bacterium]
MIKLKTVITFTILMILFAACAEDVPEAINEQFNTDSATDLNEIELVDSLFDNIEFDFEED